MEAGEHPMDSFEYSVLVSILGEGALAMENRQNIREKEQATLLMEKERLRANLLRTISHDLRTPLTAISGNASNLLSNSFRHRRSHPAADLRGHLRRLHVADQSGGKSAGCHPH